MFSLQPPPDIVRRLAPLDGLALRLMLAGVLLEPVYLANHARILTLLHWTLVLANGRRPPTKNDLTGLFAAISDHPSFSDEDPPEDAFVDIVWVPQWELRIFPGLYTGAGFHLQRLLDTAGEAGDDVTDAAGIRDVLALLRLAYADDPQLGVRRSNQRDQAFRAYRVVAEMALCTCPTTGGRRPGLSDIDAFAAHVEALVRTAEFSDAVQRKLTKGQLAFLPDGSIMPYGGGAEVFMADYLRACLEESVTVD